MGGWLAQAWADWGLPGWDKLLLYAGLFLATFVGSIAAVGFILVKLPANYFQDNHHPRAFPWAEDYPVLRWLALLAKNLLGFVLVGVGVVMLVTPGQGVLTILIGVMLLNFPGKRRLERKLVGRPRVLRTINRLRARYGKPPLVVDGIRPGPAPPVEAVGHNKAASKAVHE